MEVARENTPDSPEPLWNETQTARFLGVEARTLQSWRLKGCGPRFVRISNRCIRYRPSDIRAWVATRLRRSTSDPPEAQ